MEPMLDVSNLSFDYLSASSCLPVIDNISFQAFEGDFISIVGPSGCGKSTLLDIIAGLMPSSAVQIPTPPVRACHKTEKGNWIYAAERSAF